MPAYNGSSIDVENGNVDPVWLPNYPCRGEPADDGRRPDRLGRRLGRRSDRRVRAGAGAVRTGRGRWRPAPDCRPPRWRRGRKSPRRAPKTEHVRLKSVGFSLLSLTS